jgi:threonine/homoserine/homoserine lactone efflux protein
MLLGAPWAWIRRRPSFAMRSLTGIEAIGQNAAMDALLNLPQFAAFLAAAILITLAPGPDNLMVLSLGMARGRKPGVAFGLGCALGCLNHTLLAALGVSALIAASPPAFTALRVAGGLYLIWLGIQAIRNARAVDTSQAGKASAETPGKLFVKGLVANAINPKVILFFLAFLPQFVDSQRGHVAWQIAQLGALFTIETIVIFGAIGWFAGSVGERLARRPGIGAWLDRVAGVIFVALGLRLLSIH